MNLKFIFLLFIITKAKEISTVEKIPLKQRANESLNTVANLEQNWCFAHYSEVMNELLDSYKNELKQCQSDQSDKLLALSIEEDEGRDRITEILNEFCSVIEKCKAQYEILDFFDCVENSEDSNVRATWTASRDSSDIAAYIRNQLRMIKYETRKCKTKAEKLYSVNMKTISDNLIACYTGNK